MVLRGFVKFLSVLGMLAILLAVLLGVFSYFAIRNLDPNVFRAELEKQLQQQTGYRVDLGNISLKWGPQVTIQADRLVIFHPQTLEKLLQSNHVQIHADLASLWRKHFRMSRAVIQDPQVSLQRKADGSWNWQILPSEIPQVTVAPGIAKVPSLWKNFCGIFISIGTQNWKFDFDKIEVQNGDVRYADETIQPAYQLQIQKIAAEIREKSAGTVFHFSAQGAMFQATSNNFSAEGDWDRTAQSLDLGLDYGPRKALFKGNLKLVRNTPHFEGEVNVRDLDLDSVIPAVYKKGEYVSGQLNAAMQLSFDGANLTIIKRSLAGQGTLQVRNGALKNRNLIREVFDRLSPVVSMTNALGGELPPEVAEMVQGPDTPFQSLDLSCVVASGLVQVESFQLQHANYQVLGKGSYGLLDQNIGSMIQLVLAPSISSYLVKKIHELSYLADRMGQISIPFRYGGVFPDLSVQPDLAYVTSRLLRVGAEEIFNKGLEKLSKFLEKKKQ